MPTGPEPGSRAPLLPRPGPFAVSSIPCSRTGTARSRRRFGPNDRPAAEPVLLPPRATPERGGSTHATQAARAGFTLMELMVVIVIVAILAAVAVPLYIN